MIKKLLPLILVCLTFVSIVSAREIRTDISYLLPHGGLMMKEAGCDSTNCWLCLDTSNSTTFWDTDGVDNYAVMRVYANITSGSAQIGVGQNLNIPMDISTIKRSELIATVTFRGSNNPLYAQGTVFGLIQVQLDSGYSRSYWGLPRQPGVNVGYSEAASFKGISLDTTTVTRQRDRSGIFTVSTTNKWMTLSYRLIPTTANYYKLAYIGVSYSVGINPSKPIDFPCEVQIKSIKLEAVRFE